MTKEEIIELIKEKIERAKELASSSKQAGINSAGFNYDLGQHDALTELLEEIEESD